MLSKCDGSRDTRSFDSDNKISFHSDREASPFYSTNDDLMDTSTCACVRAYMYACKCCTWTIGLGVLLRDNHGETCCAKVYSTCTRTRLFGQRLKNSFIYLLVALNDPFGYNGYTHLFVMYVR